MRPFGIFNGWLISHNLYYVKWLGRKREKDCIVNRCLVKIVKFSLKC